MTKKREAPDREALRIDETATAIGVSRAGLFNLWDRGEGPPRVRVGRRILVPVPALRAWLAERSETPKPRPTTDPAA